MRRFRFSLEKVLKLRAAREKETELALAEVVGRLAKKEAEIRLLAERERAARMVCYEGSSLDMLRNHHYLQRLGNEREDLLEACAKIELEREEKKKNWVQARSEREVLTKLAEKKERIHKKERLREEVASLDDIANSRTAGD